MSDVSGESVSVRVAISIDDAGEVTVSILPPDSLEANSANDNAIEGMPTSLAIELPEVIQLLGPPP